MFQDAFGQLFSQKTDIKWTHKLSHKEGDIVKDPFIKTNN